MVPSTTSRTTSTTPAPAALTFTTADRAGVRDQVHRLNHATFTGEVPQHAARPDGVLVDRFDEQNEYLVCLDGDRLVGMLAVRDERPFSLDGKLEDLDGHLPAGRSLCEVRLLAVEPTHRSGVVLPGLFALLAEHCAERGRDTVLISGYVRQQRLYRRLGFVPFGPEVGEPDARFQPMYLTAEVAAGRLPAIRAAAARTPLPRQRRAEPLSLLPGPVPLPPPVAAALAGAPQAHRRPEALARLDRVRSLLRERTGARHVAVLTGSGTTANDLVAAQLRLRGGRGLVLVAGEFGERLADAARRASLPLDLLRVPEGEVVRPERLAAALAERPADWVWTVHCETSTGALFDLPGLLGACRRAGSELAVDAISTLGCAEVDLRDVLLASAASGKALAGFPGLALVLARDAPRCAPDVPRSLDLHAYTSGDGTPCTLPTALVAGLEAALDARPAQEEPAALAVLAATGAWLRRELTAQGLALVAAERWASPAVVSVRLPEGVEPARLADLVAGDGFLLAAHSGYLRDRGWVQISLMGRPSTDDLRELPGRLAARIAELRRT